MLDKDPDAFHGNESLGDLKRIKDLMVVVVEAWGSSLGLNARSQVILNCRK